MPEPIEKREREIVSELLKHSKEFSRFYHAKWKPKNLSAKWCIDDDLPHPGEACYISKINQYKITLRHLPAKENVERSALIVAHEMCHVIRMHEDKVLIFDGFSDLKNALHQILEDPVIDLFLQNEYGFDRIALYEDNINNSFRELDEKYPNVPDAAIDELALAINLARQQVEWRSIGGYETNGLWNAYEKCLRDKYPSEFIDKRDKIVSIIEEFSNGTKKAHCYAFRELNDTFPLGAISMRHLVWIKHSGECNP
jgi:hypothetical protein